MKKKKKKKNAKYSEPIERKKFNLFYVFLIIDEKSMKIDGEIIDHLRFGDDVILLASSLEELQEIVQDLNKESKLIGLKMNLLKTKIM